MFSPLTSYHVAHPAAAPQPLNRRPYPLFIKTFARRGSRGGGEVSKARCTCRLEATVRIRSTRAPRDCSRDRCEGRVTCSEGGISRIVCSWSWF